MSLEAAVGHFAKPTDAAPVDVTVSGLSFRPKALLLFTGGPTAVNTYTNGILAGLGIAADGAGQYAAALSSANGVASTFNTAGRHALKALTLVNADQQQTAEASAIAFTDDGFTLTLNPNDATAPLIGYFALGGSALTGAAVVPFQCPTTGGAVPIANAGFAPDAALLILQNNINAPPAGEGPARLTLGFAARNAGACSQSMYIVDAIGSTVRTADSPTDILAVPNNSVNSSLVAAHVHTWDADGLTLWFHTTTTAFRGAVLFLGGIAARVLAANKPDTDPLPLSRYGLHPPPRALLMLAPNHSLPAYGGISPARWSFGAAAGTAARALTLTATQNAGASVTRAVLRDDALLSLSTDALGTEAARLDPPDLTDPDPDITWSVADETHPAFYFLALDAPAAPSYPDRNLQFVMVSATDRITALAELSVTAHRSTDNGAWTPTTNAPTEIGEGLYTLDLAPADRTGHSITFRFAATGALTRYITLLNDV